MRRICCFCERWASGGIESFLCNVLTRIDLEKFQVDIVSVSNEESLFTHTLEKNGVNFFQLSGSQQKIVENYNIFRILAEKRRYDVFHLNAFQGLSLNYLHIAQQAGIPMRIAHSHNTSLRKSPTRPLKMAIHTWAKKRYAQDATELWACSQPAAEFLFSNQALNYKGFRFIPNGIDTQRFQFNIDIREKVRRELNLEGVLVVGNVGRLCYQKNQSFLLDVFAELLKENPESRLLLVGDGEDRGYLIQKAQRRGLFDKVLFYGLTDHTEQLLWAMDVFILPSRFEGLPVVGVEAQASGLPCIFSDAVTSECELTDSVQFLPLTASPLMWAKTISQMKNQTNRAAASGMVKSAGFDIETVAKQIESSYLAPRHHHIETKYLAIMNSDIPE